MRDTTIRPYSPRVRDQVEADLHGIADRELRHKIRAIARHAYGEGYDDGHGDGVRETYADLSAQERETAAEEADRG